jgi:hypothetical protein
MLIQGHGRHKLIYQKDRVSHLYHLRYGREVGIIGNRVYNDEDDFDWVQMEGQNLHIVRGNIIRTEDTYSGRLDKCFVYSLFKSYRKLPENGH